MHDRGTDIKEAALLNARYEGRKVATDEEKSIGTDGKGQEESGKEVRSKKKGEFIGSLHGGATLNKVVLAQGKDVCKSRQLPNFGALNRPNS